MPQYLETVVDKFTFRVATDRVYARDGLWVFRLEPGGGSRVRIGLSDFLQQSSGDVAFVTVKPAGTVLSVGDDLAEMETIKAIMTLPSPVAGTISAVNDAIESNPELINQSPYDKGWLAEIDVSEGETGVIPLLDAAAYFAVMKKQAEEEASHT
jgi:glycine cleavage system H protein